MMLLAAPSAAIPAVAIAPQTAGRMGPVAVLVPGSDEPFAREKKDDDRNEDQSDDGLRAHGHPFIRRRDRTITTIGQANRRVRP